MSTSLNPNLSSDTPQEISGATGTSNPVEGHPVKLGRPKTVAAPTEQRASMPDTSLVSRATTAIIEKSKSVGFFQALWNYISNSSTKSLNQARLNVAAKDYLKANPKKINSLLRNIAANILSQDPRIVQAFTVALKEVDPEKFEDFSAAVKGPVDTVLTKGAQTSSDITSNNIKYAVDLLDKLGSVIEFSQPAFALHSLAQKLSTEQMTPDLIAFCKDFPDQAQALSKRQDLRQISFKGTDCDDGLILMYNDQNYKSEILNLITPELFEGEETIRDAKIKSFTANSAVGDNFFYKDGVNRGNIPHISLPNGVEILSNFGYANSEYCKKMGKPYDRAEYLKYMLDQFKKAYESTDEAIRAFKVFVQNFTGTKNTLGPILGRISRLKEIDGHPVKQGWFAISNFVLENCQLQSRMRMDEGFNIGVNITFCAFEKQSIESFNAKTKSSFPKDTIFVVTISSHIPAMINETMDQRGQQGKQTTTFEILESRGSN
ncbi:MAG: hypothetical protein LBC11_00790 [Puniceicoccales bacterium]|jgi:hypothetical protein|nr:hypothetical protein [Puniceicoccales bacterium]